MSSAAATDWPPIAVIVSPWPSPALAAGEPERVPPMVTPAWLWLPEPLDPPKPLDPLDPPKPPKPPKPLDPPKPFEPLPELLLPLSPWSSTPRNAVAPMWTVAEVVPDSICLAMDSALLIGIAKAWVAVEDWPWVWSLELAAVSIPM